MVKYVFEVGDRVKHVFDSSMRMTVVEVEPARFEDGSGNRVHVVRDYANNRFWIRDLYLRPI